MSELGDFLEVVYGPASPFETVRGTIRQWQNQKIAEYATGGGRAAIGRRKSSTQADDATSGIDEASLSFWVKMPDRYRIEKEEKAKGRTERSLSIVNGEQEWSANHQGHVETSKPTGHFDTDLARHFDHASLREYFVALTLQAAGIVHCHGDRVHRLPSLAGQQQHFVVGWKPVFFHAALEAPR